MVKYISNYFFDVPTHLVSSMYRDGEVLERWTEPNSLSSVFAQKALDILVARETFSAGESFCFGMKRLGRARLLGQASGGGGHMNDFFELPAGFGASISVGRTYDPRTGEGWQATGVVPDSLIEKDHALSETMSLITAESQKLNLFSKTEFKIYQTIQDYTFAWYNADADEMKDIITKSFRAKYATDRNLEERNYGQQLEATKSGHGALPKLFHNRIIHSINITENAATAELVLRTTKHKFKLFKNADGWKITQDDYQDKGMPG